MVNQAEQLKYPKGRHPNTLKNLEKGRAKLKEKQIGWKSGESGNPEGLSLKRRISDILREPLKSVDPKKAKAIQVLALAIVRDAIKGSKEDRKEIWERLEGKVTQPMGGGDQPIKHIIEVIDTETKKALDDFLKGNVASEH